MFLALIVLINAGVGRTGVFITLSIVLERMQYEGVLDVFQTVRILRSQRIHMVQTEVKGYAFKLTTRAFIMIYSFNFSILILFISFLPTLFFKKNHQQDQYQFCYRAALEYLGSFDHYTN